MIYSFFIMYVNDLLMNFENCDVNILLYADDTVVYYAHEDAITACRTVENKLKDIEEWCNTNKLIILMLVKQNICYSKPLQTL